MKDSLLLADEIRQQGNRRAPSARRPRHHCRSPRLRPLRPSISISDNHRPCGLQIIQRGPDRSRGASIHRSFEGKRPRSHLTHCEPLPSPTSLASSQHRLPSVSPPSCPALARRLLLPSARPPKPLAVQQPLPLLREARPPHARPRGRPHRRVHHADVAQGVREACGGPGGARAARGGAQGVRAGGVAGAEPRRGRGGGGGV